MARAIFLFILVIPVKVFFQADFSYVLIRFKHKEQFLAFVTFILGLNMGFSFYHSKCKQRHDLSFVYIPWNSKLCISLITLALTLKLD